MAITKKIRKKRGLSSVGARKVRQKGYDDALEFALAIGLDKDYKNDAKAKKDVIDPSGDAHSVKGGQKKWQIFLYGLGRFKSDEAFTVMNGIGELLILCCACHYFFASRFWGLYRFSIHDPLHLQFSQFFLASNACRIQSRFLGL